MKPRRQSHQDDDPATPFTLGTPQEAGIRAVRLEHLIFEEIDRLFRLEVNDKQVQRVVPVSVELSPDLRNAKILYAMKDGFKPIRDRDVQEGLERVKQFLRARVADALSLKRAPDLHFHRDRMAEASLRAEAVMLAERTAELRKRASEAVDEPAVEPAEEEKDDEGP